MRFATLSLPMLARFLPVLLVLLSGTAYAWGERGHDLVARVAARVLRAQDNDAYAAVLVRREHLLAHLSNIPDILWRSQGKAQEAVNGPTHYVDLEYLSMHPTLAELPRTAAAFEERIAALCKASPAGFRCPDGAAQRAEASMAGTAPLRVRQLYARMVDALKRGAIDDALVNGGLMAHFVGDLANPHHSTRDYNGWEIGQGGSHSYFESEVISAFDLSLDQEVLDAAVRTRPFTARVAKRISGAATDATDPLSVAWALTLDSFDRLSELNTLDRKHAVSNPGRIDANGVKIPAQRVAAAQAAEHFRALAVERLATGADTLAHLWRSAWLQAGRPDVSRYDSFAYRIAPEFVPPDYLKAAKAP